MSYSYTKRPYTSSKSTNPSQAIDDSKRKSLLKDGSWIKKDDDEDESVDRDPNFAKSVLGGRYRSSQTPERSEPAGKSPTSTRPTSVQALSKRFSSQEELNKSSTTSPLKSDPSKTTTTTTIAKDDTKTTETTVTTTTQNVSRSTPKTTTNTFKDRVFSDVKSSNKGTTYTPTLPTKSTKVTETPEVKVTGNKTSEDQLFDTLIPKSIKDECTTPDRTTYKPTLPTKSTKVTETPEVKVTGNKTSEDQLFDTLIPKSIKDECTTPDSKTSVSKPDTVPVKSSMNGDGVKTTTPTRKYSTPEDALYDILLPKAITSGIPTLSRRESDRVDSGKGDDSPTSTRTTKSYEYTSPTIYTPTPYKDSRDEDSLKDPLVSPSSPRTVYPTPERTVLEKDLCSYCRKPFNAEAKMVLEDMKINCHASCFKCEVCNCPLGHLKAGDSMWLYRQAVHCESCYGVTREQWRR